MNHEYFCEECKSELLNKFEKLTKEQVETVETYIDNLIEQ